MMGIMLIVGAGFIVFLLALLSIIKMAVNRIQGPQEDLKAEITTLKKRINELENGEN